MKIPFLSFQGMHGALKPAVMQAMEKVYDSYYYINGPHVAAFEEEYAAWNQVKHCVGVSNGLDALVLSLKALGVGPGTEVIVPSNTYIASVLAITQLGGTPIFAEPRKATYNIDPSAIEALITPKTKGIMVVHLYGQCCEMQEITDLAAKNKLFVVEDNAQSHGATYNDKLAGSWGDINGTSFYPGKNLGALGDAGAITTNNVELANTVKTLKNYGSRVKYYNEVEGYNMRLDELQAAVLSVKLKHIDEWSRQRKHIAARYLDGMAGIEGLILPETAAGATHVYHLFVVRTTQRAALMEHLQQQGVGTMIHYPVPPHMQEAYQHLGYKKGDFPIAEEMADTLLSLPVWPGMTDEETDHVITSVKSFFAGK
ncbi:MAG: DegT/DnrJ/EryC1/StrS family aminotransferase [Bacteroidota bacterium]